MAALLDVVGDFADAMSRDLFRPDAKFLRDALLGLLKSQSCRLSEWARALDEDDRHGDARALNHTLKRLSTRINSRRFNDAHVQTRHLERAARAMALDDGEGAVVAVDYTDLAKPWARVDPERGQELVCECWDGSRGRKGTGYPLVQLEGVAASGQRLPLVLKPFSFNADGYRSQNHEFAKVITEASYYVGPRAFWTFDRGFDSRVMFESLDYAGPGGAALRWVVRLKAGKGSRMLVDSDGHRETVEDMLYRALPRYVSERSKGRGCKKRTVRVDIGARLVRTIRESGVVDDPVRTLIVIWTEGQRTPLVLLVGEALTGKRAIMAAVKAYKARWEAETGNRFAKAERGWGLGLESTQVLTFRAVSRMALLLTLARALLVELEQVEEIARRALRMLRVDRRAPKDLSYQICRGVAGLLQRMRRHIIAEWRDGPMR